MAQFSAVCNGGGCKHKVPLDQLLLLALGLKLGSEV